MAPPRTALWLPYYRPRAAARSRLYCFHHAGGAASAFHGWAQLVPPEIDVCAVQLPGREGRIDEPPFTHSSDVVEEVVADLGEHFASGPYAFFGHSVGARVAFGVMRALHDSGAVLPLHFFASGCPAPQVPLQETRRSEFSDDALIDELRDFAGTPSEVLADAEFLRLILPALRADLMVAESAYQPGPALPCPITALGGLSDEKVTPDDLDAWSAQTTASFSRHAFEGDHFFVARHRDRVVRFVSNIVVAGTAQPRAST